MEAKGKEVDPSGQELIEGSSIAGEISSVNHTAPSPSAPPLEERVQLSVDQRKENHKAADRRYNEKKKRNEAEMMRLLEKQEKYSGELELENGKLKRIRDQTKGLVDEENKKILRLLVDNYAGQNTEVREARINFTGETSTVQDGLNELKQEMDQAPITSNADTIFGKNPSMNLQTLPRSARPAGSSGLADDKQARKKRADKKYRDRKKWMLGAAAARTKEIKEKNAKMETENAILKAEANQLLEHLSQLRNISALLISKISQLEKGLLDLTLPFEVTGFGTGETVLPVHHSPAHQSGTTMGTGGLAVEDSMWLPQSHVSQGWTHSWRMTPDNIFDTWEVGAPVHPSETTIRSEGPATQYPLELSQSHLPPGWPHENNSEQPDSTYGDQFIEVNGCSDDMYGYDSEL